MIKSVSPIVDKVAVTSRGDSPYSEVCGQFGRTYWLMIYNPRSGLWQAIDNAARRSQKNDAGLATAELLVSMGVTVVLTGETGPKAFRVLTGANISIVHDVSGIVEEALQDWMTKRLKLARLPNDDGSPNCLLGNIRSGL